MALIVIEGDGAMVSQERDASNARKKNVVAPTLREETLTREQAPARCVRQTLTRLFSGVPSRSSVAAASATAERCTGCTCRHRTWQKHTVRTTRCRHQPCLVATSTMRSYTLWCQSTKKKYENPKAKHGLPHWQHDESQARCFFFCGSLFAHRGFCAWEVDGPKRVVAVFLLLW